MTTEAGRTPSSMPAPGRSRAGRTRSCATSSPSEDLDSRARRGEAEVSGPPGQIGGLFSGRRIQEAATMTKIWAHSGDSHFLEPEDLWATGLPADLAERAPRVVKNDDG